MRTCKLYIIRVAVVTGIEKLGLFTPGKTYSEEIDRWFIAKVSTRDEDGYRLIDNNQFVYADHNDTKHIGDCFAKISKPLSMYCKNKFISKKQLYIIEQGINEDNIPQVNIPQK